MTRLHNMALLAYYVLLFCSVMDFGLWFGWFPWWGGLHYVPAWTLAGQFICSGLLIMGFSMWVEEIQHR